jgi:2-oxoisovalerate dehydrogenase E1 component alpha subunit
MVKTLVNFNIDYYQYLQPDQKSVLDDSTLGFSISNDKLKEFYRTMVSTRLFDAKAVSLQRTGQMGTYPSSLGQEAIGTAIGHAMKPEDVFVTYYRDCAAQLLRGVTMTEILLYWGGSEQGNNFQSPLAREDLPHCVPMASQCLHAAGVATAMKIRQQNRAVLVTCGDGATSEGDFYETINVAGTWNLPLVVVIINNQWAISVPRSKQSAAKTLAQKAIAAGIAGEQVDGNDVVGLYSRVSIALEKARSGGGPTVIEAITYRMADHTTADDASRYRDKKELEEMKKLDPVTRLKNYLLSQKQWSEEEESQLLQSSAEKISQAVKAYLETPVEPVENMFKFHTQYPITGEID